MTPKQAWKQLGIAPTDDLRAIKKAYAAKLKSIDPDKDPKAFLELRDALQTANWDAPYVGSAGYVEEPDELETDAFAGDFVSAADDPAAPIRDSELTVDNRRDALNDIPSQTPSADAEDAPDDSYDDDDDEDYTPYDGKDPEYAVDHPRNQLSTILWGEETLTQAQEEAARVAFRAVIADPAMEEIDYGSQTEDWLGWMIHQTMKRSDCILPDAIEHFKWRDKIGGIHTPWYIEQIVSRARDLKRLAALRNPNHHEHAAFKRLAEPHDGPLSFIEKRTKSGSTLDLLRSIRFEFPTVEWNLNADTVALWEPLLEKENASIASTGRKGMSWWRIGFLIYLFLAVIGYVIGDNSPQSNGTPMPDTMAPPVPGPVAADPIMRPETDLPTGNPAPNPPAIELPMPPPQSATDALSNMSDEERAALMKAVEKAMKDAKSQQGDRR